MLMCLLGHNGKDLFDPNALPGYFHVKAIAIDRKIVYHGSSNLTKSSRKNVELVAGRRADFDSFPVAVRPKSGPIYGPEALFS